MVSIVLRSCIDCSTICLGSVELVQDDLRLDRLKVVRSMLQGWSHGLLTDVGASRAYLLQALLAIALLAKLAIVAFAEFDCFIEARENPARLFLQCHAASITLLASTVWQVLFIRRDEGVRLLKVAHTCGL